MHVYDYFLRINSLSIIVLSDTPRFLWCSRPCRKIVPIRLPSAVSFHQGDLCALAIFWIYGRTREQESKSDKRIILHWKWALLLPLEPGRVLWSTSSTLSFFVSETSSYHPSGWWVPLLVRNICMLASSFPRHQMPQTKGGIMAPPICLDRL